MDVNTSPTWRQVLEMACLRHPGGKKAVAAMLGISRPYVARMLSDGKSRYDPPSELKDRVMHVFYAVTCPQTGGPRPVSQCREIALSPAPTHHPSRMAVWKTCQSCPHKPKGAFDATNH